MKEMNSLLNDFKDIVFIDFEGSEFSQEIIAIGAIRCELDSKGMIKKEYKPFSAYIKIKDKVGQFIEKLTGINDELLNKKGIPFSLALDKLENYVSINSTKFIHYGSFDMHMLHNSLKTSAIAYNEFAARIMKNSIDYERFLKRFVRSNKNSTLSLVDALKVFECNVISEIHNPVNDSINLMSLYNAVLTKKNILKREYIKTLKMVTSTPSPYKKIINLLEKNKSVTYDDYIRFIEEDLN